MLKMVANSYHLIVYNKKISTNYCLSNKFTYSICIKLSVISFRGNLWICKTRLPSSMSCWRKLFSRKRLELGLMYWRSWLLMIQGCRRKMWCRLKFVSFCILVILLLRWIKKFQHVVMSWILRIMLIFSN